MVWGQIIAAIVAAAAQYYNQERQAAKQDKIATQNIMEQRRLQKEADARLRSQMDELQKSDSKDEYNSRYSQIAKQLGLKQRMGLAGIQATGGGDAVTSMAEAGRGKAIDYGDFINEAISGMDAPMLQRQGERYMYADTDAALNFIRRNSASADAMARLRMANVRSNPWLSMLAAGASAYASGGFGGVGGGTTMAGSAQPNLGGMTPQQFYSLPNNSLSNMPTDPSVYYGTPGKFGIFKGGY